MATYCPDSKHLMCLYITCSLCSVYVSINVEQTLRDTGPDIGAESLTVCLARSFWSYEVAVEVVLVIGKGKMTLGIVLEMWEVTTWKTGKFQIEMMIEMMVVQMETVEMAI